MKESTVVRLSSPEGVQDALTEVLRRGARDRIRQAVEAEVAAQLEFHEDLRLSGGRRRLVRHGHGPKREIVTGIGAVAARRPKVLDRGASGEDRIRFDSAILRKSSDRGIAASETVLLDRTLRPPVSIADL